MVNSSSQRQTIDPSCSVCIKTEGRTRQTIDPSCIVCILTADWGRAKTYVVLGEVRREDTKKGASLEPVD